MQVQNNRRKNLIDVLNQLEQEGLATREAQAVYLGGAVSASRLQLMVNGAHISVFFALSAEHALFKPRGWLSKAHSVETGSA